ncbi:MAG: cytochrome P450 [Acidimicrobiales bacterium]
MTPTRTRSWPPDVASTGCSPPPNGTGPAGQVPNRDGRTPNRHLSFALGAHHCLGHQLARLEGKIALSALIQRFDRIELAVGRSELRYKPTQSLRGLRQLPLRLRH